VRDSSFPSLRFTSGEILNDGTILQPVLAGDRLMLCAYDGLQANILPHYEFGNIVYSPPKLHPTLLSRLRFPTAPIEYGSVAKLFRSAVQIFEERGFSKEVSRLAVSVALASWLPEFLFELLTLLVYGSDMTQVAIMFSLLACLSRRPLLSPKLSASLPFGLQTTLLALAPNVSEREAAFWRATNMPGVCIPLRDGAVASWACTRILFVGDERDLGSWGDEALRLFLPPYIRATPVSDEELTQIAEQFQPQFLMFRLQQLSKKRNSATAPTTKKQAVQTARPLLMLFANEQDIVNSIRPILQEQQHELLDQQGRDPHRAMIECLWATAHSKQKSISVKELAKRVNVLLRTRGERATYDERELGWKLRRLGLERRRTESGMLLRFDTEMVRKLHQLAHNFKLKLSKFAKCHHCKQTFSRM
jgi:hypothetical protein